MSRSWQVIILLAVLTTGIIFIGRSLRSLNRVDEEQPATAGVATFEKFGVGHLAPDFQLASMEGAPVSLTGLRGTPAVIVFWSAWCPTCKEEAPRFNELAAKYESRGVRVVGINIQDSVLRTQSGIQDFGIRYDVVRDADAAVAHRYNVKGTPTVVFLDRSGVVRFFDNVLPEDYSQKLDVLIAGE